MPVGLGQRGQDAVLERLVQVLEDLDRVVAMERGEQACQALRPELVDDLLAHRRVEIGQHLRIKGAAQDLDQLPPLVVGQGLQQVGQVGFVELGGARQDRFAMPALERVLDGVDQFGGKAVVLLRLDYWWLDVLRACWLFGHRRPVPTCRDPGRRQPRSPTC